MSSGGLVQVPHQISCHAVQQPDTKVDGVNETYHIMFLFRCARIATSVLGTSTPATSAPAMSRRPKRGNLPELRLWPRTLQTLTSLRRTASPPPLMWSAPCAKESLRSTPSSSFTPRVPRSAASLTSPSSNFFLGRWTSQASWRTRTARVECARAKLATTA